MKFFLLVYKKITKCNASLLKGLKKDNNYAKKVYNPFHVFTFKTSYIDEK